MRARCIATTLTQAQRHVSKTSPLFAPEFEITVGKEYLVFGIQFLTQSKIYGCTTLFEVEDDAGRLVATPAVLFELTDPRGSRSWEGRNVGDGAFLLWPAEFHREYFHDDLSNGEGDAMTVFAKVKQSFAAEFGT